MKRISDLLRRLRGTIILCVGDIMLDHFIYGEASRLSPEAPVPVVGVKRKISMPGGMGNVARNLAEVGVLPLAVGAAGDDPAARELAGLFAQAGWLPPILLRDPGRTTSVKTRVIAGRQQVVRVDEETTRPLGAEIEAKLIEAARRHAAGARAITLSDYGKGCLTPRLVAELAGLARELGIPAVVDPKGSDYSKYRGATLVTPNRRELAEAAGRELAGAPEMIEAGLELMRRHDLENLLITRSEEGMILLTGENRIALPAMAREVADVSGAGDTVVAMMAAALSVGAPPLLAAQLATLAAGVVVGKIGTAVAGPAEIEAAAAGWDYLAENTRTLEKNGLA
ncbi:MAG: PfkB family carbohydrate kinase [Planctomycetota bacterium]|jgi:D-beta-D-heptose 7-phosphate kinase/D-beta-D-heptose 1-phosphate adenosyltransferase|nr:PfkB family carbohydrate kinase [Planctomycetota bacterium]